MSRTGKKSIAIPNGTQVTVSDGMLTVKGKGGTLAKSVHPAVAIVVADNAVTVSPVVNTRLASALWGTYAAHVRNMIQGVNEPFVKKLQIEGIGYKVELSGTTLTFSIGFSHPVKLAIPEGVAVKVEKNVITLSSADKELVGQFTAIVREQKKPEPYKGKGIRYEGEVIRMKDAKKVTSAGS